MASRSTIRNYGVTMVHSRDMDDDPSAQPLFAGANPGDQPVALALARRAGAAPARRA